MVGPRISPDLGEVCKYTIEAKEKLTDEKWLKYPLEIDGDARFFRGGWGCVSRLTEHRPSCLWNLS